jgi:hypothetical protein
VTSADAGASGAAEDFDWGRFVQVVRYQAHVEGPDPGIHLGVLEGLSEPADIRLRRKPGERIGHFSGYLLGTYFRVVRAWDHPLPPDETGKLSIYFAAVATALDGERWDPADPDLPLHTHGMVEAERTAGLPFSVEEETRLVSWLIGVLGLSADHSTTETIALKRRQRHDLLFPDAEGSRGSEDS